MGMSYVVKARFKFKNDDPASFCESMINMCGRPNASRVRDPNDPFEWFKFMTSDDAKKTDDGWVAEFNGSYRLEKELLIVFNEAMKVLEDGSELLIWPDYGHHEVKVKNGECRTFSYW